MRSVKAVVGDRKTITVEPSTPVVQAARVMTEHRIGGVPVVDTDRLVGIFTERDIMGRIVATGRDPWRTTVADVMSTDLVVAEISESYEACLHRMRHARVRHLLVLDRGRLAGILSLRDLLAVDIDEKEEAITLLNAYVHHIPADLQVKAN